MHRTNIFYFFPLENITKYSGTLRKNITTKSGYTYKHRGIKDAAIRMAPCGMNHFSIQIGLVNHLRGHC